jgi:glycosyltransferase domain-containing protein
MSDRQTILIPTYNRPALVQRLMRYYARRAPTFKLLVLDSSKPDIIRQNADTAAALGPLVRHVPFPDDPPPGGKIVRGLGLVDTPFVSLCADDDLVFPGALEASNDFLERNPDYVSAHGLYLNFRQAGEDVHVKAEYSAPGIEAHHAEARIFRLLQRYESLFYGAFRTADLRAVYTAMQVIPTAHFIELFQSVATVIQGKVKRFPAFFAARQSGIAAAQEGRDKWQTYHWFAEDPHEMLEHYRAYCEELWKFYKAHGSVEDAKRGLFFKCLHIAHSVFFSADCPVKYLYSTLQANWPGDRFVDMRARDLLEELPRGQRQVRAAYRVLRWLRRQWEARPHGYGLGRLNRQTAGVCRIAWTCHLPNKLHWLARHDDFRRNWLELCTYLES